MNFSGEVEAKKAQLELERRLPRTLTTDDTPSEKTCSHEFHLDSVIGSKKNFQATAERIYDSPIKSDTLCCSIL